MRSLLDCWNAIFVEQKQTLAVSEKRCCEIKRLIHTDYLIEFGIFANQPLTSAVVLYYILPVEQAPKPHQSAADEETSAFILISQNQYRSYVITDQCDCWCGLI